MTLTSIIVALVALIIGWVIGFFDSNMRTAQKIKAAEQQAQIKLDEAEKKIAQAEQKLTQEARVAAAPVTADDPGLLRLKRTSGRYALEVDGHVMPPVLPAEKKKRLIELLSYIRPWLENSQPDVPAPVQAAPKDVVVPISPQPKSAAVDEKPFSGLSMIGQIDTILQARLVKTKFAKSGIRMQDSIHGGVQVYVGLQKFDAIDDVPDPEIKAEIRAAVAEWERRYSR